ncbi:MAG: hypothetical protein JWM16_333, partial [Verrucomicrobiales bacterium]|nr:hypothetical protein [Verrucomicrobiales bacterium]
MNCAPQIAAFPVPVQQVRRLWKLRWTGWLCAAVLSLFSAETGLCQQSAPVLLSQPQSTNVYLGSSAAFSVTASGSVPLRYLWSGPAGAIQDATNNTLSLPQVGIQDVGAYFVKVSNQFGSTQSTSAVLSVKQDWGDAPEQYPTLFNAGGAQHAIVPGMYLGSGVTPEPDGQPDVAASADQADDGIALVSPLVRGYPCKVRVVASIAGRLDGWLDFYGNGNWSDPVDQIFASTPIAAGTNFLLFNVPTDASVNNTFARFRYSSQGGLRFGGPAPDGEVEDYMFRVLPAAADLCVTATAFLNPGGTAGYAGRCFLSVSNLGPSVAVNVLASNILAGADNLAAQGDGSCTVQGEKVVCALGNIEPGQVKSIVIDFLKAQPGVLTNAFQAHSDLPDPFPLNNRTNFTIRAADPLVMLKSPGSIRVLPGSNVIFSVEARGAGPLTYQWFSNNVAVAGATGALFMVENAQDSADFQVQIADAFGSVLSPVATLTVVRRPQVLAQPSPVSAPHGANVQFAAQVSGTPPLQFQWRLNGANIPG